ncbi:methyltransferase domain-containing protein [Acidovorax sp. NCPPB 2350]|nr:methyltransferase domain-containing protein [Acidovorax sp. NCPPB 2350]
MSQPASARILSHAPGSVPLSDEALQAIEARLRAAGDLPGAPVAQQIELLHAFAALDVGRFLLQNHGLDAHWTHEVVTYTPDGPRGSAAGPLERRIFETLPTVLATRERFGIFRAQLQQHVRPGARMASVPCGHMGELLLLDHGAAPDAAIVGIDLDAGALQGAEALARERGLADRVTLRQEDAWQLPASADFDVLASNGLNIYEPDDARVTALYQCFHGALRPGGTLVTSFLTPPPGLSPESPWDMARLDPQALAFQQLLFMRLIEARWSALRTHATTRGQLEAAGFTDIAFIDDRARLFPTVVARRPG